MTRSPWYSRLALALALLLPVYFAVAALGTKFGLWSWQTGLLTMTIKAGPILLGIVAFVIPWRLVPDKWIPFKSLKEDPESEIEQQKKKRFKLFRRNRQKVIDTLDD